jgi:serine phosphatase RsbU (regulator of sigma subunit)
LAQSCHRYSGFEPLAPNVAERTVLDLPTETYATALAAIYDPQLRELTIATAGHPGPMICLADGGSEELIAKGTVLGLGEMHRSETTAFIPPGSAVVFFTDGLTELTRDIDDGYRRLRIALAEECANQQIRHVRSWSTFSAMRRSGTT